QGQRRRIGLARLALLEKPIWILDEPTTGLDSDGIALLTTLLCQHLDTGGCAIVATHQPLSIPTFASLALA
ncbi:MAG TPA: heme ABC transporter ATP-binding protein CcmA, partial [Casimicrobiaceae bacterium]|nr:heme ABC transporter ATP-binding protein CcmA [Casimicrobiaceae bacterium]